MNIRMNYNKLDVGNKIVTPKDYEDVLCQTGLNWTVSANDAFAEFNGKMIKVEGAKVIVRDTDQRPLGIVSDRYQIVNNADAFNLLDYLYDQEQLEFIAGGAFKEGAITFIKAKLPSKFSLVDEDDTECVIVVTNTHDGTGAFTAHILPVFKDVILNIPVRGVKRSWRCTHSGDVNSKYENGRKVLLEGTKYMKAIEAFAKSLGTIKVPYELCTKYLEKLIPVNEDEMTELQCARRYEQRNLIFEILFKDNNYDKTGFEFIEAIAEYADYVEGRKTKNANLNRFMSVVHGHPLVDQAFDLVISGQA